jgi:hypothetical protein
MKKIILGIGAAAGLGMLGISTASAFPVAPLNETASSIEQVRLVCNGWGRCWHTGPRFYRYGYYRPYYRPYGPRYGYYGGPGIGFHFGF